VDLELRSTPLSAAAEGLVLTRHERRWIEFAGGAPWSLILFSAKEAAYKALPEGWGLDLGFQDVEFRTRGHGCLASTSSRIPPHLAPEVRYAWAPALVLTLASSSSLSSSALLC
jgi:4'-phosphopantetheinyl transferase EntD